MKHKLILFTLIFIINNTNSYSQWSILDKTADSLVIKGAEYIYNLEFEKATNYFTEMQQQYEDHPAGYFLHAMVDWWKILIDPSNKKLYKNSFLKKIETTIKKCDQILIEDPISINALFFKAGAIGYRARFYVDDESWVKAVKDGYEAYELLKKCLRIAPNNHDIMLGTGIYNYFAAAIPEKYPIVKPMLLMLPSGDKKIGELQLKASAKTARYASVEAKVILMQIYYTFENKPNECLQIGQELTEKYPNNPYFKKYYARTLVKLGAWTKFEKIWREILIDCLDKKFGYNNSIAREAMYYIGLALQNRNEFAQALKYYYKSDEGSRFIDKNGPSSFMVMTNLNIGKIYDRQGKRNLAIKQYQKVLKMNNFGSAHNEAQQYLKKPY